MKKCIKSILEFHPLIYLFHVPEVDKVDGPGVVADDAVDVVVRVGGEGPHAHGQAVRGRRVAG